MKIKYVYLLIALLFVPTGLLAAAEDPEGIKPGTIIRPTNPFSGRVDHSKPYLKADRNGVLRQHDAFGRRLSGSSYKIATEATPGAVIRPTKGYTDKVDHSKPYLKADRSGVLVRRDAYGRRLPGPGLKRVGDTIYQTIPITGKIDRSKPQLKIIPPRH